jgi:hypothetical protein
VTLPYPTPDIGVPPDYIKPEIIPPPTTPPTTTPGVPVGDCNTSPGCPDCMVWDGKRCRYPKGPNAKKRPLPAGLDAATCNTSPGCPDCMVWDGKQCRYPKAFLDVAPVKDAFMNFMYSKNFKFRAIKKP